MNIDEIFAELQNITEQRLKEYIPFKEPNCLYEPFRYIMEAGGKRIRPVLTMIAAGALGADPKDAMDCGVAIEILHNFTLAHDDIMDKSPMRRNRPTVHVKWNEPAAILTGDMMIGWAYKLLPKPKEHDRAGEIFEAFNHALIEVCEGQGYDMEFNERRNVTMNDYLLMIEKKTSRLLETCAVMGAHIANGTPEQVEAMRLFGLNLGLAFQIQDDMLDMTAEQIKLGKTIGQDILEGKKTYLILKAKETATETKDIDLLERFYSNNGLSAQSVPQFKEMFIRLGVFDNAQNQIDLYLEEAVNQLADIPWSPWSEALTGLVNKLNKRVF